MVTNAEHAELAAAGAAASIVLLKNDGVLPVKTSVQSIAVVGEAAAADAYDSNFGAWNQGDYYSGGGSGHMTPSAQQLVKTLDGLKSRAVKLGIDVHESPTNDQNSAKAAAAGADIVFVVVGATSTESMDRDSLSVDNDGDGLINAVVGTGKKVVVLLQVPGVVLTPWRDEVAAVAAMFLGGQATGEAWARVVFGEQAPSGRLPVQFPATESDTIPIQTGTAQFSEGLATSYRNQQAKFAFPFGHGLTYTTFEYGSVTFNGCETSGNLCILLPVRNVGTVAATDTPQVYVEFPAEARQPTPVLKGFAKTDVIGPGETQEVTIELTVRDLSYWESGAWIKAGTVTVHVGTSSAEFVRTVKDVDTNPASSCPGGSLHACIDLCSQASKQAYDVCVDHCLAACPSEQLVV
jgi:beta-glucosidase